MAFVELTDFAAYLRDAGLAGGSEGPLLQEHLDAAEEVVTAHVGERGAATVTVFASSRTLVLPVTHVQSVVAVRDPLGATVTPLLERSNLLAGILAVPAPRTGTWEVEVVTRESTASIRLAVKIIGAHLWSVRRGSVGGAARTAFGRGGGGDDDVVTTGHGYAIPRRAAQLLAAQSTATFA